MIQLQFLNQVIKSGDASLITLNNLDKSFFSDYENEFDFICNHYTEYGNIPDVITFLSKFPQFDIVEVNETNRFLLDALYDDKKMRTMAKSFNKVKDLLRDSKVDQAMNVYMSSMEELTSATHMDAIDILRDTSRYDDYIEKSNDFSKYYVRTGFPELDEIIGGWDRKEELATIIARPNVGKSWILLKVALAAAEQGLTVGLYSGEMSENKVGYRLDTLWGHISNTKITHGNRSVQNDYKLLLERMAKDIPGKIKVITPKAVNGIMGVNALRAFVEKEKIDILCIDQHSLLEDDRNAKDVVVRAANISKDLKRLQVLKRIPIVAVSQANRAVAENGTMGLENIAQADRIGQDSTVVIGLEQKDGVLSLHLLKSRDSERGNVLKYALDFDKGGYTFIPNETDGMSDNRYEEVRDRYEPQYDTGGDEF